MSPACGSCHGTQYVIERVSVKVVRRRRSCRAVQGSVRRTAHGRAHGHSRPSQPQTSAMVTFRCSLPVKPEVGGSSPLAPAINDRALSGHSARFSPEPGHVAFRVRQPPAGRRSARQCAGVSPRHPNRHHNGPNGRVLTGSSHYALDTVAPCLGVAAPALHLAAAGLDPSELTTSAPGRTGPRPLVKKRLPRRPLVGSSSACSGVWKCHDPSSRAPG